MKLLIKYRHRESFPGFIYSPSTAASKKGKDAEKRELLVALAEHQQHWPQETLGAENGKEGGTVRKLTKADLDVTFVEDDGETVIEKVSVV